jgi:hypothetical protein
LPTDERCILFAIFGWRAALPAREALRPIFTISLDAILSVVLEAGRDRGNGQGRFSFRLELGS